MTVRKFLLVACILAVGLATGCTAKEDKQPQAPAGAPKLEPKAPSGGGPGAPKPQPQ